MALFRHMLGCTLRDLVKTFRTPNNKTITIMYCWNCTAYLVYIHRTNCFDQYFPDLIHA